MNGQLEEACTKTLRLDETILGFVDTVKHLQTKIEVQNAEYALLSNELKQAQKLNQ